MTRCKPQGSIQGRCSWYERPNRTPRGVRRLVVTLAVGQMMALAPQFLHSAARAADQRGAPPATLRVEVKAVEAAAEPAPAEAVAAEAVAAEPASAEAVAAEAVAAEPAPAPGRPLYVMNLDGSGLQPLVTMADFTAQGSPEFSADGSKIAFDAWRPSEGETYGEARVFVAGADGSSPKDLGSGAMPSLSPQGNRIVFSQYSPARGVWVMYADGSLRKRLDAEGWGGQWSPDGQTLAWTIRQDGGNIRLYDLIEGKLRTVLEGADRRYQYIYQGFDFSPDGKRVCFKGVRQDGEVELAIAAVAGSGQGFKVRLEEKTGPNVAWSPDGKQILIYKSCPERKTQQLYLLDPDSEEPPKLVEGQPPEGKNLDAEWSPDGRKIVFSSGPK